MIRPLPRLINDIVGKLTIQDSLKKWDDQLINPAASSNHRRGGCHCRPPPSDRPSGALAIFRKIIIKATMSNAAAEPQSLLSSFVSFFVPTCAHRDFNVASQTDFAVHTSRGAAAEEPKRTPRSPRRKPQRRLRSQGRRKRRGGGATGRELMRLSKTDA